MDYVTAADLTRVLGAGTDAARADDAAAAANRLVAGWAPDVAGATEATPTQFHAALQLGTTLYRAQGAVAGFTDDELIARLPADLSRGIRDLLNVDAPGGAGLA